jgi:hypothetical protein
MHISARSYAQAVEKSADKLGVSLPAQYFEHIEQARALAESVAAIARVQADQLTSATLNALEAGRDHHTDKTVLSLLLDRTLSLSGIEQIARERADNAFRDMLTDVSDDILESWAEALEPHSKHLSAAAKAGLDLHRPDAVIAQGGDSMKLAHHAQAAVAAWSAAVTGFAALATVAGLDRSNRDTAPIVFTPARRAELAPAFTLARDEQTSVDAWVLARCGNPLDLATIGDFMARAATFEADRQTERQAAVDEERYQRSAHQ